MNQAVEEYGLNEGEGAVMGGPGLAPTVSFWNVIRNTFIYFIQLLQTTLAFVAPFMDNNFSDVRDVAYQIVARIAKSIPEDALKVFTKNLRDSQKDVLQEKMNSVQGARIKAPKGIAKKTDEKKHKKKAVDDDKDAKKAKKKSHSHSETEDESQKKVIPVKKDVKPSSKEKLKKDDGDKSRKKDSRKDERKEVVSETKKDKKKDKSSEMDTCLFCQGEHPRTELETHYAKECPFLAPCPQCQLLVEVPTLFTHMKGSCEKLDDSAFSKKLICHRCHTLLGSEKELKKHEAAQKCMPQTTPTVCGLCQTKDIHGPSEWKVHLLTVCPGSSRIPLSSKKSKRDVAESSEKKELQKPKSTSTSSSSVKSKTVGFAPSSAASKKRS